MTLQSDVISGVTQATKITTYPVAAVQLSALISKVSFLKTPEAINLHEDTSFTLSMRNSIHQEKEQH